MGTENSEKNINKKKIIIIAAVAVIVIIAIVLIAYFATRGNKNTASGNNVSDLSVNTSADNGQNTTNSSVTAPAGTQNTGTTDNGTTGAETSDNDNTGETGETPDEDTPSGTVAGASDETGTPVANHGELYVSGTQITDKNGNAYQLKGVSTHGIAWFPEYVNKDAFETMRDEWGINCVRLAMYSDEYNGYCSGGNQSSLKTLVNNGVSYATELGMYVIIDWHVLGEGDPNTHKADAKLFFEEMSSTYADYDNVIYEICNEPNGGVQWSSVKSYAEEVIPIIKANNPDAIIIVGTPTWSQDVDIAATNPITGYTNIMYAVHFYADTHKDGIRSKVTTALAAGLPVFISEFGICDASGNGAVNISEANTWMNLIDSNGLSCCIWNLSNKAETSSLIKSSCSKTSGWTYDELSDEGQWYVSYLGGNATGTTAPSTSGSSTSDSGNSSSGSTTVTSTPAVSATGNNTEVTVSQSGGWNDGSNNNYQYTVTIKNTSSSATSNWSVTVSFSGTVSLDQSWNGNYSVNGSSITITPVDFNSQIAAGNSVEVGFIVSTSSSLETPTVSVN